MIIGTHARVVDCRVVNREQDYWVLIARLSQPTMEVVIKLAGPEAQMACQFERTAAIYRLVSEATTISMPEIIAVDVSLSKWPWRYLIRTCLPGTEWVHLRGHLEQRELDEAYQQMGEAVGQLHGIAFSAFGKIDASGQVAANGLDYLSALRNHALDIIRSPRLQEVFLAALETRRGWFEGVADSRMCHEDLHGYNILFARQAGKWRLATILDFEKVWAGHAETDLARLALWRGMTSPDFWAAYQGVRQVAIYFDQRRPIYQLLWCLEYANPTQQHLTDTRRVCQELGIRVVDSFD
jgi:fructosamine-3-kinase